MVIKTLFISLTLAFFVASPAIADDFELSTGEENVIDSSLIDAYTKDAMDTMLEGVQPDISEYTQEVAEAGTSQDEGVMTPLRARQLTAAYLKDVYGFGTPLDAEPDEYVGMVVLAEGYTASWDPADQHADGYDGAYWAVCTATGTPGTWKATLRIDGTVPNTGTKRASWTFDPKSVCDGAWDGFALMPADGATTIEGWKITFTDAAPTTQITGMTLMYADSHPGRANASSPAMDTITTSSGSASELTEANINGGVAVADGKEIYLLFATPYTEVGHQVKIDIWYRNE